MSAGNKLWSKENTQTSQLIESFTVGRDKEFDLLLALVRRRGAVASRLELLKEVWGHQAEVMTRTVDIHIAELRRKLETDPSTPKHILTVWKAGYRLEA